MFRFQIYKLKMKSKKKINEILKYRKKSVILMKRIKWKSYYQGRMKYLKSWMRKGMFVQDLCEKLNVSSVTIRKDLNYLGKEGFFSEIMEEQVSR